jgi:hypothetical protein
MSSASHLTPQQRLANSRNAIVRHMHHSDRDDRQQDTPPQDDERAGGKRHRASEGKWRGLKRAARSWWYHHPANVALDVAKPLFGKYTRQHPIRVLGIATAAGAAVVLLRPWRLVSMGSLALAAMKSSDITGLVLSVLTPSPDTSEQ